MSQDRIRGSTDISLTPAGLQQVSSLGTRLSSLGGLSTVHTPDLVRTQQTASAIGAPTTVAPALRDMSYGIFEGQPSDNAHHYISKFIRDLPDEPMPGNSPHSGMPGESFNDYKKRLLGYIYSLMQDTPPNKAIGVILNRRSVKTVEAWLKQGATPDFTVDPNTVTSAESPKPGSVHKLYKERGKWKLNEVDPATMTSLTPGIYLIRHGVTAWNGEADGSATR